MGPNRSCAYPESHRALDHVELLYEICHAFASATDLTEARAGTLRWARAAAGADEVSVRLLLTDRAGRLREAAADGAHWDTGRKRSARRRAALESQRSLILPLRDPAGHALAILPLVSRGDALGILEVVAPQDAVGERRRLLEAVASQAAVAFRSLLRGADERSRTPTLLEATSLLGDLLAAKTPTTALRAAVRFCSERFDAPAAAWLAAEGQPRLLLAGVAGVRGQRRRRLTSGMGMLSRWTSSRERAETMELFCDLTGADDVTVADTGQALFLVGGRPAALRGPLDIIGALLEETLPRLSAAGRAGGRDDELDLSIAWTAHEFRGPLVGAKAAIDRVLATADGSAERRDLLERTRQELERLSGLVDTLLRWAAGRERLRRRPVDLVSVARKAADSCSLEVQGGHVIITAPGPVVVQGDPAHLGGAIANVVRNALTYSSPGSTVRVSVETSDGHATLSVSDDGPGVPDDDQDLIFDPFVSGRPGRASRSGRGLGLFIARHVVEAHDGRIWLDSNGRGSTFYITLPAPGGRPAEAPPAVPAGDSPAFEE